MVKRSPKNIGKSTTENGAKLAKLSDSYTDELFKLLSKNAKTAALNGLGNAN